MLWIYGQENVFGFQEMGDSDDEGGPQETNIESFLSQIMQASSKKLTTTINHYKVFATHIKEPLHKVWSKTIPKEYWTPTMFDKFSNHLVT